jgi:hypothetical protein
VIPWIIWSVLFLVIGVFAWIRGLNWKWALAWSAGGATAVLALAWICLLFWSTGLFGVR